MGTQIKITPPGGTQETIGTYISCNVNTSITDRSGTFTLVLPYKYDYDISRFVTGTDVQINQNGHIYRGWVISPPIARDGAVKTVTLEGADYTAKTQKIIVTESYTSKTVSYIVNDLFEKYVPWATLNNIGTNTRELTIRFPDLYLWDAMDQICTLTGFDWYIDDELDVHFFEGISSYNGNVIGEYSYKRGTANFTRDASKLVNKLWVKGSKGLSLPYTQDITVSGDTPIQLYYTPRAGTEGISVLIGGEPKTLGIQNIAKSGEYDFLINATEKLLIPDLCTTGSGSIEYRYEFPIKILIENEESKRTYGEYEDILTVSIDDSSVAREVGARYIDKYSKPVLIGNIEPISGIYKCGELIKVELSAFDIDEYLVIKSADYSSTGGSGQVDIKLSLENTQKDLSSVLKDMSKRLRKVEEALFGSDTDMTVERYKNYTETINYPKLNDLGCVCNLHNLMFAGENIIGGVYTI